MALSNLRNWIVGKLAPERRSAGQLGDRVVGAAGSGPHTLAAARINDRSALSIAAVWAAVNCYVNTIGSLDYCVAERDQRGGRRPAPEHPAYELLRTRPNRSGSTAMRQRQAWVGHAATRGNGYLEIEWEDSRRRNPVALHLMDPRTTEPKYHDGAIWYHQGGGLDPLPASDVLHLAMFGWDGIRGYSPVEIACETLGVAASQRDYQAGLFENSAAAQGHLEVPGNLKTHEKSQLRTFWNKMHQGPRNAGNVGILEGGMRWVQTNFSPLDAQLILGARFSVEEIARFWNLPQHKLNLLEHSSFATLEQVNVDFYQGSIFPWLRAIEQECDLKLLSRIQRQTYFCFFDARSLLRGDLAAQTAQETADLSNGVRSLNEVRRDRGDNPIEDPRADYHWIPVNNLQALETLPTAVKPDQVEASGTGPAPAEDVQATALNGAQIASLLSIAQQVAGGLLPGDSGRGMIAASFPTLSASAVEAIVGPLLSFRPAADPAAPAPAPAPSAGSLRAVLADPLGRVLRRECQALRRAARRGELDAWAGEFYGPHSRVVAEAIGPALGAILSAGHAPGLSAEQLAGSLEVESRSEVRGLVVSVPPDELPGAVDRLCSRWERDRVAALIDTLLPTEATP